MPTYQKGDRVRLVSTPSQEGEVTRLNPLNISGSVVVNWDNGQKKAYFGNEITKIEHVPS